VTNSLHRLHFKDLYVFEVLVETRNTIETAERLGMTQSAVSQALGRLETVFGSTLMDRTTRPMAITHAGEILKRGASEMIITAQRVASGIQESSASNTAIVRIALVDSFATTVGPYIVKSFQGQAERLLVLSGIAPKVNGELLERTVDFVVTCDPLLQYSELLQRRLLREPFIAVVPKANYSQFKGLSLQQMCNALPLIRYSSRSSIGRHIDYFLRQRRLVSSSNLEFDVSESVLGMVSAGIGWAITTPLCYVQARPDSLAVEVMPLPGAGFSRELYFAHRKGMPRMAQRLYDLCLQQTGLLMKSQYANLAPWILPTLVFGEE